MSGDLTVTQTVTSSIVLCLGVLTIYLFINQRGTPKNQTLRNRLRAFAQQSLHAASGALILTGVIALVAALLLAGLRKKEGLLRSDDLYTLRMPKDLEVTYLNLKDDISTDEVIATFQSPQAEAEHAVLKVRGDVLKARLDETRRRPLDPDSRLVQREQELERRYLYLRSAIERFTIEQSAVHRERLRDLQSKKETITRLAGELAEIPQIITQTEAKLAHTKKQKKRAEALLPKNVVTANEYDKLCKDLAVLEAELTRLENNLASTEKEKQQAQQNVAALETLMQDQATLFDQELLHLRNTLTTVEQKQNALQEEKAKELANAQERQQTELKQIQLQLTQCHKQLEGLEKTLNTTAPLSGKVAYRNPSPTTVYQNDPLMVIAPDNAFYIDLRIPTIQAQALMKRPQVRLELFTSPETADTEVKKDVTYTVRRFSGTPIENHILSEETTMSRVVLQCNPPTEAVRDLAMGNTMQAQLLWFPPPLSLPLFQWGLIPIVIGIIGIKIAQKQNNHAVHATDTPQDPKPANAILDQEEPDQSALRLVGEQLAQNIHSGELNPSLIATVEWILDRYGRKGILILVPGLGDPKTICTNIQRIHQEHEDTDTERFPEPHREQKKQLINRLEAIIHVLYPDMSVSNHLLASQETMDLVDTTSGGTSRASSPTYDYTIIP